MIVAMPSHARVHRKPGQIAFTRMFDGPSSSASERVRCTTPAFAAP
jgi:hypothetical protein